MAIESDLAVYHVGGPAETSLPQPVTDHYDPRSIVRRITRLDHATAEWRRAQQGEEISRDRGGANTLRLIAKPEKRAARKEPRDLFEGRALLLPIDDVGHGRAFARGSQLRIDSFKEHEPFRLGKLQRSQQDGINDREHRGCCADAERECRDRDEEKSRSL